MPGNNPQFPPIGGDKPQRKGASADFSAPRGSVVRGRLVFASSAASLTIQADPALAELYRAHFKRQIPGVHVQAGVVTIQYHRHLSFEWLVDQHGSLAEITLNSTIPWEIEFRDGVSKLMADLRGLPLRSLDLGAVSGAMLLVPRPAGAAFVYISGSASDITIRRPVGVAIRIHISSSACGVALSEQYFDTAPDGIRWQTPGYNSAADRYDINIAGSVNNLTLATW